MVQTIRLAIIPIGKSRFGFFVSSAVVETASNPMKAKNTIAAPPITPPKPLGMNGCQLRRVKHERAERDHENHHREFDQDDDRVRGRAFPNAVDQKHRHRRDDEKRGQVDRDRMPQDDGQGGGRIGVERISALRDHRAGRGVIGHQPKRKLDVRIRQQLDEIARPSDGNGHVADRVFQDQIPANDPGDDLA